MSKSRAGYYERMERVRKLMEKEKEILFNKNGITIYRYRVDLSHSATGMPRSEYRFVIFGDGEIPEDEMRDLLIELLREVGIRV